MRNLTAPSQYTDYKDRTIFDAGTQCLVLYTAAGDPVSIHVATDGWLYINDQPFGVAGMPPALHAATHSQDGSDPITPAAIGAVPASSLTTTPAAGGVPVLGENGRLHIGMIAGGIDPAPHAASHASGGIDAITPASIGAVHSGDTRLTDKRTPKNHAESHAKGGTDAITPASIGAIPEDDARLYDSRTPKPHRMTHHKDGPDPISWEDVGSVDARLFTARERIPGGYPQLNDVGHIDVNLLPSSALLPGAHASSHAADGDDPITPVSINAADRQHSHGNADITGLDASKVTSGVLDLARIPQGALERLSLATDAAAMLALTTADVQLGDTVKRLDTGVMYRVVDEAALGTMSAFMEYSAGRAAAVPWSGVEGKPSVLVTAPVTGGGSLTGDVTISIAPCSTSSLGVVQPSGTYFTVAAGVLTPRAASTSQAGVVQLSSSVSSGSATTAATSEAVKTAYDAATRAASTSQAGVVQLNNTLESSSTTQAATAYAVKQLNDLLTALTTRVTALESTVASAVLSDDVSSISGTTLPDGVGYIEYMPR